MNIIWHGQSCFQITSSQGKNNQASIVIDPFSEDIGLRLPKLEADVVLVSHQHRDHNNVKAVSGNPFLIEGPGEYEIKGIFIQGISSFAQAIAKGEDEATASLTTRAIAKGEDEATASLTTRAIAKGEDEATASLTTRAIAKAMKTSFSSLPSPRKRGSVGEDTAAASSTHDESSGKARGENTIYTIGTEELRLCHLGDFGQKELTPEQLEKIGEVDVLMIPIGGVYTISAKEAAKIMSQIEPSIIIPMHYLLPKLKIKLDGLDKFLKTMGIKSIEPLNKLSIKKKDISPQEAKIIVLKP